MSVSKWAYQPDRCDGNVCPGDCDSCGKADADVDDCVKRAAAIAVIYGQHVGGKEACENARPNTYGADLREIVAEIEDLPAADVREVVTCKECIRCVNDGVYNCTKYGFICTDGDFYCRDGKRKMAPT